MPYTRSRLDASGVPAPALLEAYKIFTVPDQTGGDPTASLPTIRVNRAAYLAKRRHLYPTTTAPPGLQESYHKVKARDGYDIPVKITLPADIGSNTPTPLIVLFHEGAGCFGDFTDEEHDAWVFSRDLHAVCINVEYRLAPEHKFPTGVQDCHDVLRWAAATASPSSSLLPADPKQGFLVGGSSAGGTLAAAMCQIARDEGLQPRITGQYLSVAALLDKHVVPEKWQDEYKSRWTNVSDPIINLSRKHEPTIQALQVDPRDPRYSPLLHENLKDLPPAYFQICGLDPLRDEDVLYAKVLEENGCKVKTDLYDGYGHMFWTNWPELERSKDYFSDALKGARWLLEQKEA